MVFHFYVGTAFKFPIFLCISLASVGYGENVDVTPKATAVFPSKPPLWSSMDDTAGTEADKTNPELFTLNYSRIKIPFEITLWVLLASFAKIGEQILK